jgi:hypothetical protein
MTFEEAIRALQRANTQARLKTGKSTSLVPRAPETTGGAGEAPSETEPPREAATLNNPASSLLARLPLTSSADEILAAARARIQQRAAVIAREKGARPTSPAAMPAAPSASEASAAPTEAREEGSAAREAAPATASSAAHPEPAAAAEPTVAPQAAPEAVVNAGPNRSAPAARPLEPRASARGEPGGPSGSPGQARPQLQRGLPGLAAASRAARLEARAAQEPAVRRATANGKTGGAPVLRATPSLAQRAPTGTSARAPVGRAPHGEARGPLIESIPRRMRLRRPASAEVRIARDKVNGLIRALHSRASTPTSDTFLARTLCVRLKAPGGGFAIEPTSPETQWMDGTNSLVHDEFALWRWTVTPQRTGRGRLALLLSVRTVGPDGVIAESAPPDRVIEVRVRPNVVGRSLRLVGASAALLGAAALGRFGEELWSALLSLLTATFLR